MYELTTTLFTTLPKVREATGGRISDPREINALMRDTSELAQEAFTVITLNAKNRVIDRHLITLGIADASIVHPREVFRAAIADGACQIIVTHNHPSGDPTPSKEDCDITRRLIEAAKILGIRIVDHVICGRPSDMTPGFVSLREKHLVAFE